MILETGPIKIGNGIERNGFITDKVLTLWGVKSYTCGVWGSKKQAYRKAEKLKALPDGRRRIEDAVKELRLVERYRAQAMERHGSGDEKHKHQLQEIRNTRQALEQMIMTAFASEADNDVPDLVPATTVKKVVKKME